MCPFFFFNDTATTEIYTLSLHDALPILAPVVAPRDRPARARTRHGGLRELPRPTRRERPRRARRRGDRVHRVSSRRDRKSTRLNSSHQIISYSVFCLKKKKNNKRALRQH